jgi:hypothetical protein
MELWSWLAIVGSGEGVDTRLGHSAVVRVCDREEASVKMRLVMPLLLPV